MFRKLTDRLSSAASSVMGVVNNNNSEENEKVQQLTALGFDSNMAVQALQATQGNVDQAAELLLSQQQAATPPSSSQDQQQQQRPTTAAQEEEQLQRAMQESYDLASARDPKPPRTAAMHKAAEAAARRAGGASNPIDVDNADADADAAAPPKNNKIKNPKQRAAAAASVIGRSASGGGLAAHHPDVKVIPKLQDKSKEEQIMRCTDRLRTSPAAVDTLLRALLAVQKDPLNVKFRTIDKTSTGYQRSIANAPGAQDLLLAMNYRHDSQKAYHDTLILDYALVDPALLYLGISALEQLKLTSVEYKQAKRRLEFTKQMAQIRASADYDTQEALRRAAFLSQCPSEPLEGRGAWIQVILGDGTSAAAATNTPPSSGGLPLVKKRSNGSSNNYNNNNSPATTATETLRRRFDGDDTLQDVLHWLGAHGSLILEKLQSREWILRDLNRGGYPLLAMDIATQGRYTLQYIGCWPSGRLDIVPSDDYNYNEDVSSPTTTTTTTAASQQQVAGSIRGLGAAPKDVL